MTVVQQLETNETAGAFVNRQREILEISRIILNNQLHLDGRGEGDENNKRVVLPVTCQMFGAGKTWLGLYMMDELKKRDELQETLVAEFGKNRVARLLSMQHVFVNLKNVSNVHDVIKEVVISLCRLHLSDVKMGQIWNNIDTCSVSLSDVVLQFETSFEASYLLQLDDPSDSLCEPNQLRILLEAVGHLMNRKRKTGAATSSVFITGRSPLFYLMGSKKLLFKKEILSSPSNAHCIVLDNLKLEHVMELLLGANIVSNRDAIGKAIIRRTNGVPRFVRGAIDALYSGRVSEDDLICVDRKDDKLLAYMQEKYEKETNVWAHMLNSKNVEARELAVELIRMAALGCPFKMSGSVPAHFQKVFREQLPQGYAADDDNETLFFCSTYALYLERILLNNENNVGDDEYYRFIIPPICLDAVDWSSFPPFNRLPFLVAHESMSVDKAAEIAVRNAIRLRVSDKLVETKGEIQLGLLLPCLASCHIGSAHPTFTNGNNGYGSFPKIVTTGCNDKTSEDIKALLRCGGEDVGVSAMVLRSQLGLVWEHMEENILYLPAAASSSTDIVLRLGKSLLEIQVKSGEQKATVGMMSTELKKTFHTLLTEGVVDCIAFLMVSLGGLDKKLTKLCENATQLMNTHDNRLIGYQFGESSSFGDFKVPQNMDVIVLTHQGLCDLLTEQVVTTLIDFKFCVQTMHLVASPVRQRQRGAQSDAYQTANAIAPLQFE